MKFFQTYDISIYLRQISQEASLRIPLFWSTSHDAHFEIHPPQPVLIIYIKLFNTMKTGKNVEISTEIFLITK